MSDSEQVVRDSFARLGIDVSGAEEDVIETGLLDSLGLVSLIGEVEQLAGIQLPFESLEIDDFRTIESISALIDQQRAGVGS